MVIACLDLAILAGYVVIAWRWQWHERARPRDASKIALRRLKHAFLLFGLCGSVFIAAGMFWPALQVCVLVVLVYLVWRYALEARDLKLVNDELERAEQLSEHLRQSRDRQGVMEAQVNAHTAEPEKAVKTLRDEIEARKRAAQLLAEERNLLHTLIDAVPDWIYVKDVRGRYMLNNQAHLRFLGASSPEQVAGKTVHDLFPPDAAAR
ncbi:MAG: PAS domain-containing protein, partial [Opitutaceae bacterium]